VYYMIMYTTCQRNLTALELACVIVTCHVCLSTERVPLISQESSAEISSNS
jgi:RNase P subunit RPR2